MIIYKSSRITSKPAEEIIRIPQKMERKSIEIAPLETGLVRLCIEAATESKESIEKWKRQRRTLEKLPTPLAEALLRRLLRRRLVSPSLLEVFKLSIEEIDVRGENYVDSEWMAYIGAFRYLRKLGIAECRGINNSALWAISGMGCLKELDLSRCTRISDAAVLHLISIPYLEKLSVSETSLTADGVTQLCSLRKLSFLDLGGLPVTDTALYSLQVLTKLEYLDIWGSKISNSGAASLKNFTKLTYLNLAWTKVTEVPCIPSLTCLNMSNCTVKSIFEEGYDTVKASNLTELHLAGVAFTDFHKAFSYINLSQVSSLDISNSSLNNFQFLLNMTSLEHLDLSFSKIEDNSIEFIASVGATLKVLNLSNTRLGFASVASLTGCISKIESLSLSSTAVDDAALRYIGEMVSLKVVNLSCTNIKGHEQDQTLSLTALENLILLERLELDGTQVRDGALEPLCCLKELKFLTLKSDFFSDVSMMFLSLIPKLEYLGIFGAVLTDAGVLSFKPPRTLKILDLRDCWLLTKEALLEFHQSHPQVEVRHGNLPKSSTVGLKPKLAKTYPSSSRFQKEIFVDERRKYSREELLEWRLSPLSQVSVGGIDIELSKNGTM